MRDPLAHGSSTPSDDPLINRIVQTLDQFDPERIQQVWDAPSIVDVCSSGDSIDAAESADDRRVAEAYARHYLMPLFDPPEDSPPPVDPGVADTLSAELCRQHRIVPLADDGQFLEVAIAAPESLLLGDQIKRVTGRQMQALFAPQSVIERLLDLLYDSEELVYGAEAFFHEVEGTRDPLDQADESYPDDSSFPCQLPTEAAPVSHDMSESDFDPLPHDAVEDVSDAADHSECAPAAPMGEDRESQAFAYFHRLIEQTVNAGAEGIHIESWAGRGRVQLRIGGRMHEVSSPTQPLFAELVDHIKRLGKMERRFNELPQQGRIRLRSGDQALRLKVNRCATTDGEKLVIGVGAEIDPASGLSELGFEEVQSRQWASAVDRPGGLVLAVGPSNSGKTTTLYAGLGQCNREDQNLCTAEQRPHAQLAGVQQVTVGDRSGQLVHEVLPTLLHQDPDVILVDEIDDPRTAELCLRAASTGPLVLAGLHAADALSGLERTRRLAAQPLLLGRSLRLIVAQRLLRRLCPECRVPWEVDHAACRRYDLAAGMVLYQPGRCAACCHTGYRGRVAVVETLPIGEAIAERITADEPLQAFERALHESGHRSLAHYALQKAVLGETTLQEVDTIWGHR